MPLRSHVDLIITLWRWGHQPSLHVISSIEERIWDELLYAEDCGISVFCPPQVSRPCMVVSDAVNEHTGDAANQSPVLTTDMSGHVGL